MSILHRLGLLSGKKNPSAKLEPPPYLGRHQGQDFLVLAAGPSLVEYSREIRDLVERTRPVVMGGNFLGDTLVPDYHAFVNRKRFCNHAKHIHPKSRVLLSPYFPRRVIRDFYAGDYEEIAFRNKYPSEEGQIRIVDGIIEAEGATLVTIMIGVAIVMGARNVLVAGMDGYSRSSVHHHYHESDDKPIEDLIRVEKSTEKQLACLDGYLHKEGLERGSLSIITPTVYQHYYRPLEIG